MASSEKKPRKGILKTSTSFDSNDHHPKNKEMSWDEMNIMATHHPPDKDYGHMKIDEPPTPYSKCSDPEDDDEESIGERRGSVSDKSKLDAKSLSSRLEDIEAPSRRRRVSTDENDSSDDEEELTEEEKEHRRKFEQKRKIHYNEFQAVKLAKQLMEEEDDDDEEDETGDNGSNTQDSVQMQTDQSPSTDSSGANITTGVQNVSGSTASGQTSLAQTTMDAAGHLETQIN